MTKSETMANGDAVWLGMEDPTNLMMVAGVMTFASPLDMAHLHAILSHRWLKFDRFRQRVVSPRLPLGSYGWEEDPTFDLNAHLHHVALPGSGDKATLQAMVGDLLSTPLDFSKPLWQLHIIDNYKGGTAVFCRIHHAIADGLSLAAVLLSLTDLTELAPWPEPEPAKAQPPPSGGVMGMWMRQAKGALNTAVHLSSRLFEEGRETLVNPARVRELAQQGAGSAQTALRMALRSPDPDTLFRGALGVRKAVAWSNPLPLADIKAIKTVMGGGVNDVVITAVAGGLRRYLLGKGQPVGGLSFRVALPVNIRSKEEMLTLGNKFGLVFLDLPVGEADVVERLAVARERLAVLKQSPEAVLSFGMLQAVGLTPAEMQAQMAKMWGGQITAVLTNLPGPPIPLYLAGQAIDHIMVWEPQLGRTGLSLSILSYAGQVYIGITTDAGLVPDPDLILDGVYAEYEEMMVLAAQAG
ncbi:MAG: wax ester/triacylglycerol synthase family O-acyltransferase [Anaerolineales bacterium]|nr:wax ester/triacylglycerol synthase family O-acyltransferase [Anaerolineales bacterium]